jgi:hypothetical protein
MTSAPSQGAGSVYLDSDPDAQPTPGGTAATLSQ